MPAGRCFQCSWGAAGGLTHLLLAGTQVGRCYCYPQLSGEETLALKVKWLLKVACLVSGRAGFEPRRSDYRSYGLN